MFGKNAIVGQKFFDDAGEKLFVTSIFMTLQGEGPYRGEPALFVRLAKCNLACSFCFVPSTPILMGDGSSKMISEITVGDQVMSWDGTQFVVKPVVKTYESIASRLLKVEAGGRKFWVTPEHPFLTSNRGWVNAEDLQLGDILVHFNNSERMKWFNPVLKDGYVRPQMSEHAKEQARQNLIKLWQSDEFRNANIERLKTNNPMKNSEVALKGFLSRQDRKKSTLETRFEKICEGLPIKYIGDGTGLTIAHRIPDFIVDGQNKVVEIWASDADFALTRDEEWMRKRRELFAKHGYQTLFLPLSQKEMRSDNHQNIRERVASFIHNGIVITSVSEVKDNRAFARLYGSHTEDKKVYNFEVADTHTYVANGCVVHNCDTYFDGGDWLTFDEVNGRIDRAIADHFNGDVPEWAQCDADLNKRRRMVLVITGGEPMLQKNLGPFLHRMENQFEKTQIESNGTLLQDIPESTTLVVSPKCSEKSGRAIKYLQPKQEVLARASCLKFVMSADQDSPYSNIPEWAHDFAKSDRPVFISPMNIYNKEPQKSKQLRSTKNDITLEERSQVDEVISFWEDGLLNMKENQKNHEYAAQYCAKHGFILNLQIHLYASLA